MSPDVAARVAREHAAVLARIERGQAAAAGRHARRLLAVAHRAGLTDLAAQLHLTCAWIELDRGDRRSSWAHLDAARPHLRGVGLARARCLRGLNLCVSGQHRAALTELNAAVDGLRRHGDRHWLGNALIGRGTVHGYLSHAGLADHDFQVAAELFTQLDELGRAAACVHNRGFSALISGDLPRALRHFDDAQHRGLCPRRHPEALVDRAQALMAAGLADEAQAALNRAAGLLVDAGRGTKLAEAMMTVAHCALQAGDPRLAMTTAVRASAWFARQRRPAWRAATRAIELIAALRLDTVTPRPEMARIARACERHGWWLLAAELRLTAGARSQPRQLVLLQRRRYHGPAASRALGWLARARLASAKGERRGVLAACRAGLRVMDRYAASIGAWELQAGVYARGIELARLGLSAAVAGGRPRAVLNWADRHRAAALCRPAVVPPTDTRLAERLAALRHAVTATAGRSPRDRRRITELENDVRALEWHGDGAAADRTTWRPADLAAALGQRALVSYAVERDMVIAVSVMDGRYRLHEIAPAPAVAAAVRALRFAATLDVHGDSTDIARAVDHAAADVDRLLLAPVARLLGDRPVVVVPTGALHALPWTALPSCRGRPVSVAPSVASWLPAARAATAPPSGSGDRVWIAGPGLAHAEAEVRLLCAAHGGRVLAGAAASVAETMSAISTAAVAHIAAHGRFRADQPLFSSIELADGPLYGYDLRRGCVPRWIVLSACDVGLSAVRPGDEVIGLAAALLRAGAAAVVASVLPVPDEPAMALMAALHAGLSAGLGPAAALARAQSEHGQLGFVCLGAG